MKKETVEDYRVRMLRVLVHIQKNLDRELPLEELATIAHFSSFHFHRIFGGLIGESVKEHVRRLRLERAAHRLRHTGQQITEIALDAGYQTPESFTRAFHRMFSKSPTEFRIRHGVVAYGPAPSGVHFVANGELESFRPASGSPLPLEVRIEHLPEMHVAFVRHTGPYEETDTAYERLMTWADRRGLLKSAPVIFGIAYDDPTVTAPENLRYEAALVIPEDLMVEGEIGVQSIQGGNFAVTTHCGLYNTLGETYTRFCGEWLLSIVKTLSGLISLAFSNRARNSIPRP